MKQFGEMNDQRWSLLEGAEVSTDRTTTSHTVSEDIHDSDEYVTNAEDTLFEISRYLDNHPADVNPLCQSPRPCHPALKATIFHFVL